MLFFYGGQALKLKSIIGAAALSVAIGSGAQAQFMTAAEVRPILDATQGSWVAVRVFDGQDLLYFTHLLSFRCGLDAVFYGLNGEPARERLPMEPCYEGTASPSAMDPVNYPPYTAFPVGSVHSVTILMKYDDGGKTEATFQRAQIQIQ